MDMKNLLSIFDETETDELLEVNDSFDIEIGEDLLIETGIVDIIDEDIVLEADEKTLELLAEMGITLDEADQKVIPFPSGQGPRQMQFRGFGTAATSQNPGSVSTHPASDPVTLYQEFKTKVNPQVIRNEDAFIAQAFNFLQSKPNIKVLKPEQITAMAKNLLQVHRAYTKQDKFYETKSLIVQGINEAIRRNWPMQMGSSSDASSSGSFVMGEGSGDEPEHEDTDADDKRWDDKDVCPHCKKDPCECDHEKTDEAKYQGREVPIGKPMAGDVKKSKVYVKKPNGKVVKVNFGDKNMRIKKSNPKRRKSFRARHHCKNPGPRWKARYWSCRAW